MTTWLSDESLVSGSEYFSENVTGWVLSLASGTAALSWQPVISSPLEKYSGARISLQSAGSVTCELTTTSVFTALDLDVGDSIFMKTSIVRTDSNEEVTVIIENAVTGTVFYTTQLAASILVVSDVSIPISEAGAIKVRINVKGTGGLGQFIDIAHFELYRNARATNWVAEANVGTNWVSETNTATTWT
jgi:hypothetical protein